MFHHLRSLFFFLCIGLAGVSLTQAQGTAFTYQGRLTDGGSPANGIYDLRFTIYDSTTNGSVVGNLLTNSATAVSNGLFIVTLDFSNNFPGAARWLEIAAHTNGNTAFTTLAPRQPLTPAPYAITAGNLSGTLASTNLSGIYGNAVNFNNTANSFAGNGGGLTNVNAATVNGLAAANFWQTAGNSGTSPTTGNFLGTLDNHPLELRVNNQRVLRLEPTAGAPNFIAGSTNNFVTNGIGVVIGGGGGNSGGGTNATVPGGNANAALGNYSFAAGNRAKATNQGAFVWADSQSADFSSTTNDQFNVRAGGGVRIFTGQTNMTLDGVPVLVGSGVGVLAWQTIGGTSLPAQMHYGYVLTNSQLVTVSLPTTANIGDVFRISGAGGGGWKITQAAGQSIRAGDFTLINNPTLTWTASDAPAKIWNSIACSADGNKMVAASGGASGQIYVSTDSGVNWSLTTAPTANWTAVASSADGVNLVAVVYGGQIYLSANSGGSWTPVSGSTRNWGAVASSADGTRLVAGVLNGAIYYSVNSGGTWTNSIYTGWWHSLAASADGMKLVGGINTGYLNTSTDGGVTWITHNTSPNPSANASWTGVASSADGTRLVAVASSPDLLIQTSSDGGNTWTTASSAPSKNWESVASSADGKIIVAAPQDGPIYTSSDFGATWTANNGPVTNCFSVASSYDGGKLAVGVTNIGIYTLQASAQRITTAGTAGYLLGGQNAAVELQYIGNNQFIPISHEGTIFAY